MAEPPRLWCRKAISVQYVSRCAAMSTGCGVNVGQMRGHHPRLAHFHPPGFIAPLRHAAPEISFPVIFSMASSVLMASGNSSRCYYPPTPVWFLGDPRRQQYIFRVGRDYPVHRLLCCVRPTSQRRPFRTIAAPGAFDHGTDPHPAWDRRAGSGPGSHRSGGCPQVFIACDIRPLHRGSDDAAFCIAERRATAVFCFRTAEPRHRPAVPVP